MQYWKDGTKVIIFSIMDPKQLFGDDGDTKGDVWHQISAPQRSAALWGGEREEKEGGGVQDAGWGQRGIRALAAASVGSKDSIRSMTSAMLGPDHIYRRKSPAAEPPTYPGRAGPGPRGAATAFAHLRLTLRLWTRLIRNK